MAGRLAALLVGAGVAALALELVLRLAPGVIAPRFLQLFESGLRAQVAAGRYPVRSDFVALERDDFGPPLLIPKPDSRIVTAGDPAQLAGSRRYDEIGFCNARGEYEHSPELDLVSVGDSFTWCHHVEASETWSHKLGEITGRRSYNLGRGGFGPYEYVVLLRRFGIPKRPKTVVMNLYGGNDLRDSAEYQRYREALRSTGRAPADEKVSLFPSLTHSWLGRHSRALNLLIAFVSRSLRLATHARPRDDEDFRYAIEFADGAIAFNVRNGDTDEVEYARRAAQDPALLAAWDEALAAFVALSRTHGFDPVVSFTPSAHIAYSDRVRFSDESVAPLLQKFDRAQREHLQRLAGELGFAFHDLEPDLRRAAEDDDSRSLLYDPEDLHFTLRAHQVVAESIARFLAARPARP